MRIRINDTVKNIKKIIAPSHLPAGHRTAAVGWAERPMIRTGL